MRCCFKCSTASGRNASSWSSWTTIICSTAGSWDFRPDHRSGILRPSRRTAIGCRPARCCQVHEQTSEPSGGQAAVVGRAFFGGRNADRGVGLAQEFLAEDERGLTTRGRLPRPAAQKRHLRQALAIPTADFTARPPGGSKALLHGPCHHGEPAWAGGGRHGHACQRHCRAPPGRRSCSRPKPRRRGRPHHGGREGHDTADHVAHLRAINVTPHVTQNDCITATRKRRRSAIMGHHAARRLWHVAIVSATIECIFGWGSSTARCARPNIVA